MKKYQIVTVPYTSNNEEKIIYETDSKDEAVNKLRELEGSEYDYYLMYKQICYDNYEMPAPFYPSYYIKIDDVYIDIEHLYEIKTI